MLNFSPPEWFEEGELKLACFTITDIPGGQYIYTNRNREWVEDYLSTLSHGAIYYIHYCGGSPGIIKGNPPTLNDIATWWLSEDKYIFPPDAGCYFTFTSTDRRTHFMLYGYDRTPEREWVANPIGLALSRVPHKTRKQRKLELSDPSLRPFFPKRIKKLAAIEACIPKYIHGKSLYNARCFADK